MRTRMRIPVPVSVLIGCLCGVVLAQLGYNQEFGDTQKQTLQQLSPQFMEDSFQLRNLLANPVRLENMRQTASSSVVNVQTIDQIFFDLGVDTTDKSSTAGLKQSFTGSKEEAVEMGKPKRAQIAIIRQLSPIVHLSRRRFADQMEFVIKRLGIEVNGLRTKDDSCRDLIDIKCDRNAKYRTADGSCNNLDHPLWGRAFIPMRRFIDPVYNDNVSDPRIIGHENQELPSARAVSQVLHVSDANIRPSQAVTHMVMQFGQFLDHDITHTPIQAGVNGAAVTCCIDDVQTSVRDQLPMNVSERDICFPIQIPRNDATFRSRTCLNFVRSIQVSTANCQPAPVEQLNQISAYIDGSQVYGSSEKEQRALRTFTGGLLKTSDNNLLPENEEQTCILTKQTDYCFKAGDERVNEQMSLASLHTVWMREHNTIAKELASVRPKWDDETLFQETRRIVSAEIQHITYREFLPVIFNNEVMTQFALVSTPKGFSDKYNDKTDSSIRNAFATAAFRFGHSLVQSMFSQLSAGYVPQTQRLLKESFGNTSNILDDRGDGVNTYIRGLVTDRAQRTDAYISPQLTQHLFEDSNGNRLDLASLNIQRGRDHGLPSYNRFREWCGLSVAQSFDGLVDHPRDAVENLRAVYQHPDDIDLFPGGVSESNIRGGLVGPTFACLLAHQFKALKEGDRFWYERNNQITGFTEGQLNAIKQWGRFSRVLCDNTDIQEIQKLPFRAPRERNERQSCSSLPRLSLKQWSENPTNRNNEWGPWSGWSPCSDGWQTQTRQCLVNTGCKGDDFKIRSCESSMWGPWGQWSTCRNSVSSRRRTCQGQGCQGNRRQRQRCGGGSWTAWEQWSPCFGNNQERNRICLGPTACRGRRFQRRNCFQTWGGGEWGEWDPWGSCRNSKRWRGRECVVFNGSRPRCTGPSSQSKRCGNTRKNNCSKSVYTRYSKLFCEIYGKR